MKWVGLYYEKTLKKITASIMAVATFAVGWQEWVQMLMLVKILGIF